MLHKALAALGCTFALSPFAVTQTTYVVDAAGGGNFTDLPAAFAAVADGDTLMVRRGRYSTGTLTRAIRMLCDAGAVVNQDGNGPVLRIDGISAGKTCSVRGLEFIGNTIFFVEAAVTISNCAGVVALDELRIETPRSFSGGLTIENCTSVTINNSYIRSRMNATDSNVNASNSQFLAYDSGPISFGVFGTRSTIELNQCVVRGSQGGGHAPAADGIRAEDCELIIRGDAASEIRGGSYVFGGFVAYSINGLGSSTTVEIDPDVTLSGAPNGVASTTTRNMALLEAVAANGSIDLSLSSAPGDVFGIFLALPGQRLAVPPFGAFWLDLPTLAQIVSGSIGPSGEFSLSIPINLNPADIGLALQFQALTNGSVFELTNAAGIVLR